MFLTGAALPAYTSRVLPFAPPLLPMLSKKVSEIPAGEGWIFEPKWDGFRTLIFKDNDDVNIQSRDAKPLNRYFPELVSTLKNSPFVSCVLDGEIVIAGERGLEFETLQTRLHPAASRAKKLAAETPASIVFWDLLADGDRDLRSVPFHERRARLEALMKDAKSPLYITPLTTDRARALDWFERFEGAGFDGVMAKRADGTYEANKRTMLKIKHERECDCVVAGFRWHKGGEGTAVGSLLLGLFDDDGVLHHVGVCASFTTEKRKELVTFLTPYRENALDSHPWKDWATPSGEAKRTPGMMSRWSNGKDLSWEALRPELVVEVAYDHMQGSRFRHTAQFRRWRSDKPPSDCTYAQLEVVAPAELKQIFGTVG